MCLNCDDDYEPSGLCGSLRPHQEHVWIGQTTGDVLYCPGVPSAEERAEELRRRADEVAG